MFCIVSSWQLGSCNIERHRHKCPRQRDSLSTLLSTKNGYKSILKNNIPLVLNTIDYIASEIGLAKICRVFKITTQQYYRYKNKVNCTASVLNLCYKTHPRQLTVGECSSIKEAVNAVANSTKRISSIWYDLMRKGELYCSCSTFYKYSALLSERIAKIKYSKPKSSIIASRIFEFIHIDTTFLPTQKDGSVRAVIIKDNYSKKILHQGIVENGNSKWIALLLQKMFSIYGFNHTPVTLISDGGSENKGKVLDWIDSLEENYIIKKTARTKEFIFTNNEIESTFNIFKNEFLAGKNIVHKQEVVELLQKFQLYNDNERFPLALYGCTPQEVFDGAVPDKYRFRADIKRAEKSRYERNKVGRFCDVCS